LIRVAIARVLAAYEKEAMVFDQTDMCVSVLNLQTGG
jgi:hypothetical protein